MNIKILGSGCTNCKILYGLTEEAVKEMNVNASIEKVEEIKKIMEYGIMRTPALVINEKVKMVGKIPSKEEIKKYISEELK